MNIFFIQRAREIRFLPLCFLNNNAVHVLKTLPSLQLNSHPIQMLSLPAKVFPTHDVLKCEQTLPLPDFALNIL